MKQPTKKTGIRIGMLLLPLAILLLLACNGGNGRLINGGSSYPLPGPEESAVRKLCDTLGTIEGQSLNGTQLAAMRYGVDFHPDTFGIALPVTNIDERPLNDATYTNKETGGTLVFHFGPLPAGEEPDSVGPVGTIDMRNVIHSWESSASLPDSADTMRLRARGNSIYTPYRWVHTGRHKYNNYTPQWFAEYHGGIIYVYPGADSLVLTYGYEASKRIYRR